MSRLRALLYKEWRDQRALIVGALVMCLLMITLGRILGGKRFSAELRSQVLPVCLGLFSILLATETIARDAHSGVEKSMERLPVSRTLAWLAKASFVVLCSAAGYVALLLLESVLRWFERRSGVSTSVIEPGVLVLIAGVTAACFATVCVVKRSIPAAILGLLLVAIVPLGACLLPVSHATQWIDAVLRSWTPTGLAGVGAIAFTLASFGAFRVRRHDRFGLRRLAGGAIGASLVLAPVLAVTSRVAAWAFDITPFSPTACIRFVAPSPEGRFIAVRVGQEWTPVSNWISRLGSKKAKDTLYRTEVWILDRSTSHWNQIDDRFRDIAGVDAWDAHGQLLTVSSAGAFGGDDRVFEHVDPVSGIVVSRSAEKQHSLAVSWYQRADSGADERLTWTTKHSQFRFPRAHVVRPSPEEGVVFHDEDGFVVRHELDPDNTTRLVALGVPPHGVPDTLHIVQPSPNGRLLYVQSAPDYRFLIDACDGHIVRRFDMQNGWYHWSEIPGRLCIVWHLGDTFSALNEDGSETPLPGFEGGCHEFGSDRLLRFDEQHIECMKLDGSDRQVLYESRP